MIDNQLIFHLQKLLTGNAIQHQTLVALPPSCNRTFSQALT